MTRLAWGAHGERYFEAGTDRGVLYLSGVPGVPWNGLKAVNESPEGGEPRPYYIDGFKYLNVATAEEFKATLEAFSSPLEFARCDGTKSIHNGLFATQQPRVPFSLSYRTLVGNDFQGIDHGYKVHVVYNCLAAPASRNNQTVGTGVTPLGLSWAITTTPPKMTGLKPTAHMVIDSRLTPPALMAQIEDILYGSEDADPRLPDAAELLALFGAPGPISRINYVTDPRFTDPDKWTAPTGTKSFEDDRIIIDVTESGSDILYFAEQVVGFSFGDHYSASFVVENLGSTDKLVRAGASAGGTSYGPSILIPHGERRVVFIDDLLLVGGEGETLVSPWLTSAPETPLVSGDKFAVGEPIIEKRRFVQAYFDGGFADTDIATYEWDDEPNNSVSIERSWY